MQAGLSRISPTRPVSRCATDGAYKASENTFICLHGVQAHLDRSPDGLGITVSVGVDMFGTSGADPEARKIRKKKGGWRSFQLSSSDYHSWLNNTGGPETLLKTKIISPLYLFPQGSDVH